MGQAGTRDQFVTQIRIADVENQRMMRDHVNRFKKIVVRISCVVSCDDPFECELAVE